MSRCRGALTARTNSPWPSDSKARAGITGQGARSGAVAAATRARRCTRKSWRVRGHLAARGHWGRGSARGHGSAWRGCRRPRVGSRAPTGQRGGDRAREQPRAGPRGEAGRQALVGDAVHERGPRQPGQLRGRRRRRRADQDGQAGGRAVAEQRGERLRGHPLAVRHPDERVAVDADPAQVPRRAPRGRRRRGPLAPRSPPGAARPSARLTTRPRSSHWLAGRSGPGSRSLPAAPEHRRSTLP